MPVEARTRITLFVPAPGTLPQFYLVDKLLTDLLDACDGVTVSSDLPAVFTGLWFNEQTQQTERDANLLIMADAPVPSILSTQSTHSRFFLTWFLSRRRTRR